MDAATDWVIDGGQYALDFDGSNDRVDIGSAAAVTTDIPFSVSLWLRSTNLTTQLYPHALCLKSNTGTTPFEIAVSAQTGYTGVIFGSASTWGQFRNNVTWTSAVWNHVVLTYSGGTSTLTASFRSWVNGVEATTATAASYSALTNSGAIGGVAGGGSANVWFGQIAEVVVFSRQLTPNEPSRLYQLGRGGMLERRRRRRLYSVQADVVKSYLFVGRGQLIGGGTL
jgi:hypothetical protein